MKIVRAGVSKFEELEVETVYKLESNETTDTVICLLLIRAAREMSLTIKTYSLNINIAMLLE